LYGQNLDDSADESSEYFVARDRISSRINSKLGGKHLRKDTDRSAGSAKYTRDVYSAVVFLVLAIVIGLKAARFPLGELKRVGPGFFPLILAIALGVLSLALLKKSLKQDGKVDTVHWPDQWRGIILAFVSLFIYALVLDQVGFIITTLVFTLVLFKYAYPKRWLLPLIGSITATVSSFTLFKKILAIPLPSGILGF
jgi:putative tricarboxylic transport membrane protein